MIVSISAVILGTVIFILIKTDSTKTGSRPPDSPIGK